MVYPLAANERVKVTVTLPQGVEAPVTVGMVAGKLTFSLNEEVIGETELLYSAEIPKNTAEPSLLQRVRSYLSGEEQTAFWERTFLF